MSRGVVETDATPRRIGEDAVFIVWEPPGRGPRSRAFGAALGIDVVFVSATSRRGRLAALYKYPVQGVRTLALLLRRRPRLVFVQNPPSPAVIAAWIYARLWNARYIVDAHSCALRSRYWTRPRWLYRGLTRGAAATIVTNEHLAATLRDQGGAALVIRDVPQVMHVPRPERGAGSAFTVMVVCTYAPDEPIDAVLAAAAELPEVSFICTGDPTRFGRSIPASPPNVRFTGFLDLADYRDLMASSDAVMCLTTHDHTMQRGACEALWAGRPIITSDWPLLRDYFDAGTAHVDNTAAGIREAVRTIEADRQGYEDAIGDLQARRRQEWEIAVTTLTTILHAGTPGETTEAKP